MAAEVLFEERQAFRQPWLWGLLGLVAVGVALDVASDDESSGGSVLGLVVVIGVGLLLAVASLTTQVRHDGIYVRFVPRHLTFRWISWDELESVERRTYRPIREFGGWGLRWRPGRVAYTVSGSEAVVLHRAGERSLWIGTKRPDAFVAAVNRARA